MYPKLEKLLEKYDTSHGIWSIDLLPISLDKINPDKWKKDIVETSLVEIERFLEEHKPKNKHEKSKDNSESTYVLLDRKKYIQDLFFEYIKTSILKPNTISNKLKIIFDKLIIDQVFIKKIDEIFKDNPDLISRWGLNIPKKIKSDYLIMKGETLDLISFKNNKRFKKYVEYLFWVSIFENKNIIWDIDKVKQLQDVASYYYHIDDKMFSELIQMLSKDIYNKIKSKKSNINFKLFIEKIIKVNLAINTDNFKEEKEFNLKDFIIEKEILDARKNKILYINNAGLVLLHPFLEPLFKRLGYLDEKGTWKNKQLQHRAVLITQYLINFKFKIFENDLLLNKILCGVSVTETVPTKWKITKKEKEQTEKLLLSVIVHWKVLKKTSVKVLQESFLQREGKIEANKTYELTVEQRSIDMLLDQLPWGLGMIKTPWMESFLTCYWN